MNKQRRAAIDAALKELEAFQSAIDGLPDGSGIASTIEEIASEEREYYDGMPENMQSGEKGESAEQAASNLEQAASDMSEIDMTDVSNKVAEIIAALEAARDGG